MNLLVKTKEYVSLIKSVKINKERTRIKDNFLPKVSKEGPHYNTINHRFH